MDTSEQYILMCAAAKEIQEETKVRFHLTFNGAIQNLYGRVLPDGTDIWLPRQDQLQEILAQRERGLTYTPALFRNLLNAFITIYWETYREQPKSMEQTFLMMVMKENYNKEWDKENKTWKDYVEPEQKVYSRKECVYNYCPHPETCKKEDKCCLYGK